MFVNVETEALRLELAEQGASLAAEQEAAIGLASTDRQLVVIVGQAGTGKSTALLGVSRAHEQDGRRVIVTSTGAQAAERLARELRDGGVHARGFSTASLRANVKHGHFVLDARVTILHDEAALASTREQRWLLGAARDTGARLIEIGDPRQSQAVGAGGLWPRIEAAAREHGALVELTRIVRARDPADRRDQSLFRAGDHERAIKGYMRRDRVVLEPDRRRAEDRALDAAQADRVAGRSTLVIAETSNERLDMLNARAQAIRAQEHELGEQQLPLAGRPYGTDASETATRLTEGEGLGEEAAGHESGSRLNASVVAQDAIERATLLLSRDYSQINAAHADVFPIPSLVMSSFQTPRQMIEAVNAYNNWTAMIDTQRRLVYQERPAEPLLEFGAWSGEEIEDTSAGEGSEIFNRVIVEGTNAEGDPVSYAYLATQFDLEEGKVPAEPRWEGEFGGRFEVSSTATIKGSKPTAGDARAGDAYLLTVQGKINGSGAEGGVLLPHRLEVIWLGAIAILNFAAATEAHFKLVVGVPALAASVVEPPIEVRLTNFTKGGTATARIEHITITIKQPTLVDQRRFRRTKTIQVSNVLTEALAYKLAQTYLEGHAATPYGGSLTAKVGSVRRLPGGQRVHPSLLCQSVQELIRVSHAIDPDTGGVGRDGRIAAVEYTHAGQSATVTLNSRLQNFEALMARLAIVEEAGS